ncbi:hypothetical protein [Absidia glauca]|uniref:Retrotransposon gag domain-containing protein n=1 Tax=Absidia glauca TaxID=4829 RepID=A0A163IZD5_ABSGL|nr:hypothetical protein [Absidia glauca]
MVDTLVDTMRATEEELQKTVAAFQQLIIKGATQKDFDANEKRQATLARALKRMKEDFEGYQLKKENKKEVNVPKNLPALQLEGDKDAVPSKTKFETIDRFVDVFEMVLYQHQLAQDSHWEACLISSLQHSMDKITWFKEHLMDKQLNWAAAKKVIKKQYGGDHSLSWYLEKLTNMKASKHENPAKFVEKFCTVLRGAACCSRQEF